jgi:hypothetical protein
VTTRAQQAEPLLDLAEAQLRELRTGGQPLRIPAARESCWSDGGAGGPDYRLSVMAARRLESLGLVEITQEVSEAGRYGPRARLMVRLTSRAAR